MRQPVFSLIVVLLLVTILPVRGQTRPSAPASDWTRTVVPPQAGGGFQNDPSARPFEGTGLAGTLTPPLLGLQGMVPVTVRVPAPFLNPEVTTLADMILFQRVEAARSQLAALGWRLPSIMAQPVATSEQSKVRVAGVFTYKFKNATVAPAPGNTNYTGPDSGAPTTHEGSVEFGFTVTASPTTSLFADLNTKYTSDSRTTTIGVERLNLTKRDAFGVQGLNSRIGRDGIRLGAEGLLLDEVLHDDDRRDGLQLWLPPVRGVRMTGFLQYALGDWTTTRRVWGGRAEADIRDWTIGLNYRADTASASDAGTCPGLATCNTGTGFGVDMEGNLRPGVALTIAYANYRQTGDVARSYDQVDLVFDLDQLSGPQALHPVFTTWYKNFDPYTIPGADGTAPRGGFLTPDDFKLFSVNDNLAAVGSRVDLQLTRDLALLALGEWGTYKGGGPNYSVVSVGLKYGFPQNSIVKLTYNAYAVGGGSVTSPNTLISLSSATVYQLEFTKSW